MQIAGIRGLVLLYLLFFIGLAGQVVSDALTTQWWTSVPDHDASALIGIAAISGWFAKAVGLVNFLFGLAGGLFSKPTTRENAALFAMRYALLGLTAVLIGLSLLAMWFVADAYATIPEALPAFHAGDGDALLAVSDAVDTLGTLNLAIASGFLIGLAVPGVPGSASAGD